MPNSLRRLVPALTVLVVLAAPPAWAQSPATGPQAGPPPVLLDPVPEARCGDTAVAPVSGLPPPPRLYGRSAAGPISLDFSIAPDGRTLDIRPAGRLTFDHDVQSALAGWRFTSEARTDCRLTVRFEAVPVDRASPELLARYFGVTRTEGPVRDAAARRLAGEGADCRPNRTAPRRTPRPDFKIGSPRAGVEDWTIVRWDIGASGQSIDPEVLASSGDADFDAEVLRATALREVDPGPPQRGCLYNWYRRGAVLAAPPLPTAPEDPLSDCPAAVLATYRPSLSAPPAGPFLHRGIEGWALVRFDIAPWGEIENAGVIEAQPASAFGDVALAYVGGGRAEAGAGAIRCVQPVIFRTPEDD